jgi:hypothetical protein
MLRVWALVCASSLAVVLAFVGTARAADALHGIPTVPSATHTTNGAVTALVRRGDTIWLGGRFSRVGTVAGNAALVDSRSGAMVARTPRFDDQVHASVPDGVGGFYVAGSFETVDGERRPYLVRLRADGTVDPGFTPRPDAPVFDLEVAGNLLYAAGAFRRIAGAGRTRVARFALATGALDASWAPRVRWPITDIAVDETGRRVVAIEQSVVLRSESEWDAGTLTRRLGAYRLDGAGARDTRVPRIGERDEEISSIAAGGGRIFIARGQYMSAYDAATMRIIPKWDYTADGVRRGIPRGVARTMVVSGDHLIVGGQVTEEGTCCDPSRPKRMVQGVVVMDAATGRWAEHQPRVITGDVRSLAVDGSTLYVGGIFSHARPTDLTDDEAPRANAAAFNLVTGELLPWQPDPGRTVDALAVSGDGRVFVGGDFATVGERQRAGLAAVDAVTGALREDFVADLTRWSDENYAIGTSFWYDTPVTALQLVDGELVVGGLFRAVNGVPARHLAVLDPVSGAVRPGMPSVSGMSTRKDNFNDGSVSGVASMGGGKVLVTGSFARLGGARRPAAAIFDVHTGRVLPWRQRVRGFSPRINEAVVTPRSIWVEISTKRTARRYDDETVSKVVMLNRVTGRPIGSPRIPGRWFTSALATDGRRVWVAGGYAGVILNSDREGILEFDAATARLRRTLFTGRRGVMFRTNVMAAYGTTLVVGSGPDQQHSVGDLLDQRAFTTWKESNEATMLRTVDLRTGRFRSLPLDGSQGAIGKYRGFSDGTHDTSLAPDHALGEHTGDGVQAIDLSDGVLAIGGDFTGAAGRAQPFFALFGEVKNAPPRCEDASVETVQGVAASLSVHCVDADQPTLDYALEQVPAGITADVTATPIGAVLRFTPAIDSPIGELHLLVRATDRRGATTTATVTLNVHARNVPPGEGGGCTDLDFEVRDDVPTLLRLDCNGLQAGLTWADPSDPAHGRLNQFDATAGTVRFIPTGRYAGADEFTVQVRNGASAPVMLRIKLVIISVHGTSGNDHLHGGQGPDRINGGAGRDTILGGGGADRLNGGTGNDVLRGGSGADQINATAGRDDIDAGTGNDLVVAVDGARDVVRCGRGKDVARVDSIDVVVGCERVVRAG